MMKIANNKNGFTLIELMTVVSFIAILSAIAIPNYMRLRTISKASEAKYNLGAIRTCEEQYRSEHDIYLECGACPNPMSLEGSKQDFTGGGESDFHTLGFKPVGKVWFQYSVTSTDGGLNHFLAKAEADLDRDGESGTFQVDNESKTIVHVSENIY